MATEIKDAALSWSGRQLELMKLYLPYVVIVALSYGYMIKDRQLDKVRSEEAEHLKKDIDFDKEAYKRSTEAYLLMLQIFRNEKDTQSKR